MLIRQVRVLLGYMETLNNDGTKIIPEVSMWLGSGASYFAILAFTFFFLLNEIISFLS